jgi:hypothetical protein
VVLGLKRRPGDLGGVVTGAVIYHQDLYRAAFEPEHYRADEVRFVKGGDDHADLVLG